eukprot:9164785-Pyramimonas_sp.AAC.1
MVHMESDLQADAVRGRDHGIDFYASNWARHSCAQWGPCIPKNTVTTGKGSFSPASGHAPTPAPTVQGMESPPHASTNAPSSTPAVQGIGCPPSASQSAPTPS